MSGPANAVVGDIDQPTSMPQTNTPKDILVEEKKLAKYSKTAEFKRLKEFLEARISFYQRYLPNGDPIDKLVMSDNELNAHWIAACVIIREIENILSEYAQAADVVNDYEQSRG